MKKENKYEILKSLPPYGSMYIPILEDANYSEGFVVKFIKSDKAEWIANFKKGWTGFDYVHSFENSELIVVVSDGTCYIMHPDEQKPRSAFCVRYKSLLEKENGGLVLEDLTNLTIIEPNGKFWHSKRISYDGFKDISLNENMVTGLSFKPISISGDEKWIEFSFDLETKEIFGGSYNLQWKQKGN